MRFLTGLCLVAAACGEARTPRPDASRGGESRPAPVRLASAAPAAAAVASPRGPHEPAGFVAVSRTWTSGDPLPPSNRCAPPNAWGMCAWPGQAGTLTYAPDSSLRVGFPVDPKRWPEGNGGGAPSRWMWKAGLPPGQRSLYVRTRLRLSPGWTQRGRSMGGKDWNVGTKFFFPVLNGVTASGDTTRLDENNYVNLVYAQLDSDCADPATRCSGADWVDGPVRHRLGLTFQHQGRHWGNQGADLSAIPVPRGQYFTAEFLFTIGDSVGRYDVWVNDSIHRSQPIITPWFGVKGGKLTNLWWAFVWSDPTFGGGTALPPREQWFDVSEFYVSVGRAGP